MTRFRIQVWREGEEQPDMSYVTYGTMAEAEHVARKYCAGLPYRFDIEEEEVVEYETLVA
jgi:hypothetical protein